jgi:uncharacterized hydrophobic protein (TIGR00271 family)
MTVTSTDLGQLRDVDQKLSEGRLQSRFVPTITARDLVRMRSTLLFDGPNAHSKLSKFWVLLVLASCIAAAGVIGDSTATVIGAMIVAPLMTPIMGTVLSISTSDRANLIRSLLLVVGGAAAAIAVGYLMGLLAAIPVVADTSSQVAGRVQPRLIDLLAAIATGAAGAFAQCREDVSDTLPGVAIAISLVPPLTVVGLTLEGGQPGQSWGAMLLFLTNVAAILLTGIVVMALFGVHRHAAAESPSLHRRTAVVVVVMFVVAIAVPLGGATYALSRESQQLSSVGSVVKEWVHGTDWLIVDVLRVDRDVTVVATGPLPAPDTDQLRQMLDDHGLGGLDVTVRLVPEERVVLHGG